MNPVRRVAVIDIGKTNAKLALVDLETLTEVAVVTRPNRVLPGPPWPHFDTEGHWRFLLDGLRALHRRHGVDGISVTTHGASVALLGDAGGLAAPILDYEHDGPDAVAAEYDALRPPFAETGSPRLPGGLNVGAQLHWQFRADPGLRQRVRTIVAYPQYWAHRLTGVAAVDVTSIGCHTDLWNPSAGTLSSLADRLALRDLIAPVRRCAETLGPILPAVAEATGLRRDTPVLCGIHDSNASLHPHLLGREPPFSVVSTGTWVIAMAIGGSHAALDPARDCVVNVNAFGDPVPSARFMGGREFELIQAGAPACAQDADRHEVMARGIMLLPAVEPKSGPFQGRSMRWVPFEPPMGSGARESALSCYLALVTAECLNIAGAKGEITVEGPFARNRDYRLMLQAATGRRVIEAASATGTSIGAAMLFGTTGGRTTERAADPISKSDLAVLRDYAARWKALSS